MKENIEAILHSKVENYLQPYLEKFHEHRIYRTGEMIEVKGLVNKEDLAQTIVIRFFMDKELKHIYISNIFMPTFMKHQNIGKCLISLIYSTSADNGYRTFISDLTRSFFERLVTRRAKIIDEETVEIDKETQLI